MRTVKLTTGNVVGTDGAMKSFRSKLLAAACMYGPFTAFPTYNPAEMYSPAVLRLGGKPYTFDEYGRPQGMPNSAVRNLVAASRPALCATFFNATMRAKRIVCYGWEEGAHAQKDGDCVFGQVSCRVLLTAAQWNVFTNYVPHKYLV